jgi:drug/metabolite transporter (DMT)-like permease
MKNNEKTSAGYISATVMSVLIGIQFIFIKNITGPFEGSILQLLGIRFLIAMLPFVFLIKKISLKKVFTKNFVFLALLQPFLNLIAQTYGVVYTSVSSVAYVTSIGPLITIVLSALILKEKINKKKIIGLVLAVGGAVMVVVGKSEGLKGFGIGGILIFVALVFRSLYSVKSKGKTKSVSVAELTFAQLFWGTVMFLVTSAFFGGFVSIGRILMSLDTMNIISLIYTGLISLTAVYFLNNFSISKISVAATGILSNLTFVVTLASGILFMKEKISILSIAGAVIIMAGVFISRK